MRDNLKLLIGIITAIGVLAGLVNQFLPNPQIISFGADPENICSGEYSKLSWSITGATSVTIDNRIGEQLLIGNTDVWPTETTNYTLTAINWFKKETHQIKVSVKPKINYFEASPSDITIGNESTLSWRVDGATNITISNVEGEQEEPTGETQVSPNCTTTYTLTATNEAGSTSNHVEVTVIQKPFIYYFYAIPDKIEYTEKSTLNWRVDYATSISISHGADPLDELTGSCPVGPLRKTTTYNLTATNRAGRTTTNATVERVHEKITIGLISSSTQDLGTAVPIIEEILEPDISEYVDPMGYDVTFDFIIADNQESAAIALENIQGFKAMGVNLVICHGWSPQYQAVMSYANENDMLLFSLSSTSPVLAIPDDRLFRASPTDFEQVPAIAQMWKTWGVDAVLTFYRADAWGDGLWKILEKEWQEVGIENLGGLRYSGESKEFSSDLQTAEGIITYANSMYGKDHVGMQFFSSSELMMIQTLAQGYPALMDTIWMTTGSGGRSQAMLDNAGDWATQTRHFSALMAADYDSSEFIEFDERYYELTEYRADFYSTALYDTCRLLVECILETGSTEASDIAEVLIPMSQDYYGLTGRMSLNENGDRQPQMFDIWGFYEDPVTEEYLFMKFGEYDVQKVEVLWDDDALVDLAGIIRPGP